MLIFHNYRTPYRDPFFELLAKHFSLTVLYLQKPEDDNRLWDSKTSHSYESIQFNRFKVGKLFLNNILLPKSLKTKSFDFVIFIDNLPNIIMMLFYALFYFRKSQKILWSEECDLGYEDNIIKKIFQKWTRRVLLTKIDEAWFFSEKTSSYWNMNYKVPIKSKTLFQSPYSYSDFAKIPQRTFISSRKTFGYLGYFSQRKGILDLIQAFEAISDRDNMITLKLAGDGDLKEYIRRKSENNIELFRYLDEEEKTYFFSAIDFLVLPSHKDPWGLVVNEAMAHGVIPIVSDESGAKEMVEGIGYIFTSGSIQALIRALNWGINLGDEEIIQLSQKAKERSKDYVIEKNIDIILENSHLDIKRQ